MSVNSLSRMAYGTINPMRFVMDAPGIILGALQCTANGQIIGVANIDVDNMPGTRWQTAFVPQMYPCAASGEPVRLYEENDWDTMVVVASGHTVLPNQFLYSDASGNAVPLNTATASNGIYWVGAKSIEGGVAGDPIRVKVQTFPFTKT